MSEQIFEEVVRTWHSLHDHLTHHHYHHEQQQPSPPPEDPVSLATIVEDAKKDVEAVEEAVKNIVDTHLPKLGEIAQGIEDSPLVQLALDMAGTIDPAVEAMAVKVLKAFAAEAPAPAPAPVPAPEPATA